MDIDRLDGVVTLLKGYVNGISELDTATLARRMRCSRVTLSSLWKR